MGAGRRIDDGIRNHHRHLSYLLLLKIGKKYLKHIRENIMSQIKKPSKFQQ